MHLSRMPNRTHKVAQPGRCLLAMDHQFIGEIGVTSVDVGEFDLYKVGDHLVGWLETTSQQGGDHIHDTLVEVRETIHLLL